MEETFWMCRATASACFCGSDVGVVSLEVRSMGGSWCGMCVLALDSLRKVVQTTRFGVDELSCDVMDCHEILLALVMAWWSDLMAFRYSVRACVWGR